MPLFRPPADLDIIDADIQPVGGAGYAGNKGLAADSGHGHPGPTFVVDVAPYNVGVDDVRIQAAIKDAAAAYGAGLGAGTVVLGRRLYNLTAGVTIPYGVRVQGQGRRATTLSGTGFVLVDLNSTLGVDAQKPSLAELLDCTVLDPVGNAATVGVAIYRGGLVVQGWALRRVEIFGNTALGAGAYLGIGLYADNGLEGMIDDVTIQFWNQGVNLNDHANANTFLGGRIRQNNTGMALDATITDCSLFGTVVEGNNVGVASSALRFCPTACHFENGVGVNPTNIHILAGVYAGALNSFAAAGANRDIVVDLGVNGRHSSYGDNFGSGVTLNNAPAGGGFFTFHQPTGAGPSGIGPAISYADSAIVGVNCSTRNLAISGPFNLVTFDSGVHSTGVGTFDGGVGLDTVDHTHALGGAANPWHVVNTGNSGTGPGLQGTSVTLATIDHTHNYTAATGTTDQHGAVGNATGTESVKHTHKG